MADRMVLMLLATSILAHDFRCPELEITTSCRCTQYKAWLRVTTRDVSVVNCSFAGLVSVPQLHPFKITQFSRFLLFGNNITTLRPDDFLSLDSVEELDLSANTIELIANNTFSSISQSLKILRMARSFIHFDEGLYFLSGLENLEEMILDYNDVKNDLDILTPNLFRDLRLVSLKKLSMKSCSISGIHSSAFVGLESLEELDLSYNYLEGVPAAIRSLTKLRKLVMYGNNIKRLSNNSFIGLHHIEVLDFNVNFITDVETGVFHGLENSLVELKLYYNDLYDVPTQSIKRLHNLRSLVLSRNNIRYIERNAFTGLHNLKSLELNSNPLIYTNEMFEDLSDNVESLSLRKTNLTSIPIHALSSLKKLTDLDLSFNRITSLRGIGQVRVLNLVLEKNGIGHISPLDFHGLKHPIGINLDYNYIRNISFMLELRPCTFTYLDLVGNPVVCDCSTEVILNSGLVTGLSGTCTIHGSSFEYDLDSSQLVQKLEFTCNTTEKMYTCQNRHYFVTENGTMEINKTHFIIYMCIFVILQVLIELFS